MTLQWPLIVASSREAEKAESTRFFEIGRNPRIKLVPMVAGPRRRRRRVLMSLSMEETAKIAILARLAMRPDELTTISHQLTQVLDYIDQLRTIDTEEVAPLAHAAELFDVFAEDIVSPGLDREAALGNAPQRDQECFLVPAVLGE